MKPKFVQVPGSIPTEFLVARSSTLKDPSGRAESRPLAQWRDLDAYVLLGEPGSGKSTAFRQEAEAMGDAATYVTARDLLALGKPEDWRDEILFIDALDEHRSASTSPLASLDDLRRVLKALGRPKFRLSCREADWIASGVSDLLQVSPSKKVEALWLDPLSSRDIESLLHHWSPTKVSNPEHFLDRARQQRLTPLLANPLLLKLLVDAVSGDKWPDSRQETYDLACVQMAIEHNDAHRLATAAQPLPSHQLTHAAGLVCALLLLSDRQAITLDPLDIGAGALCVDNIPPPLGAEPRATSACLNSKLFVADGSRRLPRHRTIAEYLGAKAISKLISEDGLPVSRVLALMSGQDGHIVDPMRGLYAWLALHSLQERQHLIDRDPLGLVLYGDVRPFSTEDKRRVLQALFREGERFRWFRNENWEAHPFGALGTSEMEPTFRDLLDSPSREPAHQVMLDCIADAIEYGDTFPQLPSSLERIVRDHTYWKEVRTSVLDAWLNRPGFSVTTAKDLLVDIRKGNLVDDDDELCGRLLTALYPAHLTVNEALRYLRPSKRKSFIGHFHMFWAVYFLRSTRPEGLPSAVDRLARILSSGKVQEDEDSPDRAYDEARELAAKTLVRALDIAGDELPAEQLYRWLGIGVNKYGSQEFLGDHADSVREWLSKHPKAMRDVFAYGSTQVVPDARDGRRYFWVLEERLFRAQPPRDWYQWLLEHGAKVDDADLAKFCLQRAAHAAINPSVDFDITREQVEEWVTNHLERWPNAEQWKIDVWSWPLDSHHGKEYERRKKQEVRHAAERAERQRQIAPQLPDAYIGQASPHLFDQLVGAYRKRFYNIKGETPLERVQDFLVVEASEAARAIEGVKAILTRADLPTPDDIGRAHNEGKTYFIGAACLLAAELVHEENSSAWTSWSEPLLRTMLAFCLTGTVGSMPSWYESIAQERPSIVAPLLLHFGLPEVAHKVEPQLRALYGLRDEKAPKALAQLALPELFRAVPYKPSPGQLRFFDSVVIAGCKLHIDPRELRRLIEDKLDTPDIDLALRTSLHVAGIQFNLAHCTEIVDLCNTHPEGPDALGATFERQGLIDAETLKKAPACAARIAAVLAKSASPEFLTGLSDFTSRDSRRDSAYRLMRMLAADPSLAAGEELRRLREMPELKPWAVHLDGCCFDQERIARTANFASAGPEAVANVLANAAPANARDMAELMRDQLALLARRIQFEETNWLELFYHPDGTKAKKPKTENECRDIVQSLLRDRMLLQSVQIEKESYAAGDKRADMQGSIVAKSGRIVVPVEVKKDNHPEVWMAWRDQLERRYSANPAAEGIGIYLVFWFGLGSKPAPDRTKPKSARHMAELLNALIPADRRSHIAGLVIDLSRNLR